jgi:hypothetical protein
VVPAVQPAGTTPLLHSFPGYIKASKFDTQHLAAYFQVILYIQNHE